MLRSLTAPRATFRASLCRVALRRNTLSSGADAEQVVERLEKDEALRTDLAGRLSTSARISLIRALVEREEASNGRPLHSEEFFSQADLNQDGVVTKEEFHHWIHSRSWFGPRSDTITPTAVPEQDTPSEHPDQRQCFALAIQVAIPFVGFGFLDNAIMILAGNSIENSLGAVLTLSTMAAAGLGNLLSDVAGIGLSNYIEAASHRLGLPDPRLTPQQTRSPRIRWVRMLASMVGIAFGCLLGLSPLLFMTSKDEVRLRRIFSSIDCNNNGEIDFEEFHDALKKMGFHVQRRELRKFFAFIDLDDDGTIDFEEFCYLVNHLKFQLDPLAPEPSRQKLEDDEEAQKSGQLSLRISGRDGKRLTDLIPEV